MVSPSAMPWNDVLRFLFIGLFTALTLIRLNFKIKAGVFRQLIFSPEEGILAVALRIELGIPLAAATAAYILWPDRWAWTRLDLPPGLRLAGFPLGVLALAVLVVCHRALGRNFSTTLLLRRDHHLVTTGPYGVVRHPMYLAYIGIFGAAFLLSSNWVVGTCGLAIIILLMTLRLSREESLLRHRFGSAFEAYARRTPKFFPRLSPKNVNEAEPSPEGF